MQILDEVAGSGKEKHFDLAEASKTKEIFLPLFIGATTRPDVPLGLSGKDSKVYIREYQRGKHHCTVDLLFDWFKISSMTTDIFCFKQTDPNQSNRG